MNGWKILLLLKNGYCSTFRYKSCEGLSLKFPDPKSELFAFTNIEMDWSQIISRHFTFVVLIKKEDKDYKNG